MKVKIVKVLLRFYVLFFVALSVQAQLQTSGHIKLQHTYVAFPENSIYQLDYGTSSTTLNGELRFNSEYQFGNTAWDFKLDYQLLATHGENLQANTNAAINDDARLFELTHAISTHRTENVLQRLDRFNIAYTGESLVLRLGRQALSWGNGYLFSVMDIVNPFDGRVFDQEYKSGDDMFYTQYLLDNGNDFQVASVFRREAIRNNIDSELHTHAVKYHAFVGEAEWDVLLAQHYGDELVAFGFRSALGDALIHMEFARTDTEYGAYMSGLLGGSYSWVWAQHNFSGALEYYYNGMGVDAPYSALNIQGKPAMFERLSRGETRLLGQHYLAGTVNVELTPLFISRLTTFLNLDDQSALWQLSAQYSWQQNVEFFFALSLAQGDEGSELLGYESHLSERYFSQDEQMLIKLAWYY